MSFEISWGHVTFFKKSFKDGKRICADNCIESNKKINNWNNNRCDCIITIIINNNIKQ